jgi:hypothetical protein
MKGEKSKEGDTERKVSRERKAREKRKVTRDTVSQRKKVK